MFRRKEILGLRSLLNLYGCKRMFHVSHCCLVRGINSARNKTAQLPEFRQTSSTDMHVFKSNENFYGIEGDKGVILVEGDHTHFVKSEESVFQNRERKSVEKLSPAAFGVIRCDYQNKVKYHGQYEEDDISYMLNRRDRNSVLKLISVPLKSSESKSISPEEMCEKYNEIQHSKNGGSENKIFENIKESQNVDNSFNISERPLESKLEETRNDAFKENNSSNSFMDQYYFQDSLVKEEASSSEKVIPSEKDDFHSNEENFSLSTNEKNYDTCLFSENIHTKQSDNVVANANNNSSFIEEQYFQTSLKNTTDINHSNFDVENSDTNLHDSSIAKISSKYVGFNNCNFRETSEFLPKIKLSEVDKVPPNLYRTNENNNKTGMLNSPHSEEAKNDELNYKLNNAKNSKIIYTSEDFSPGNETELKADAQDSKLCNNQTDKKALNVKFALSESLDKTSKSSSGEFFGSKDLNDKEVAKNDIKVNFAKTHERPTELGITLKGEEIETAYDFAKKLRAEENVSHSYIQNGRIVIPKECKRDSKGFKILENQVPDFSNCTNDEIVELLRNNVLYSDDNLIVLNKPYNLVIHESETTKDRCLSSLLEDLAKDLDQKNDCPKLFTVHRLDKETTGCLLLARSEIMAQTLKSYFAQRKILKKYFIITSKVPEPLEGIIDIPIAEGFVQRKSRMVLQPQIPSDIKYFNHCRNGKRAVTQYKVISYTHNAALVEVRPETGIKHQIRVHFGFALSCPILGDHKYSHLTKMAPQKLQADILQKLHVRQSKVRYIPLHIHAQSIVIPQYFEDRNFFVSAPLPEHMKRNMKALKLIK